MAIWLLIATKVWELTKSLIEDLITPLFFTPLFKKLKIEKLEDLSWKGILYWRVLARLIDFVIIAFSVFLVVKYASVSM